MVFRSRRVKNKYRKLKIKNKIIKIKSLRNLRKFNWYEFADVALIKEFVSKPFPFLDIFFFNRFLDQSLKRTKLPFSNFCLDKKHLSSILLKYKSLFNTKSLNFEYFLNLLPRELYTFFVFILKTKEKPKNSYVLEINNTFDLVIFQFFSEDLFSRLEFFLDSGFFNGFFILKNNLISISNIFDFLYFVYRFYTKFFPFDFEITDTVDNVDLYLDINTTEEDKSSLYHFYNNSIQNKIVLYNNKLFNFKVEHNNTNPELILPFFQNNDFFKISFNCSQVPNVLFSFFNQLILCQR